MYVVWKEEKKTINCLKRIIGDCERQSKIHARSTRTYTQAHVERDNK